MEPVTVEVFYSQTCPSCPPQKELAREFESDGVKVRMTDVGRNQGRAKNHGVRATPTTVIDGPEIDQKMGFTGVMKEEKLDEAIKVAKGEISKDDMKAESITEKLKDALPI